MDNSLLFKYLSLQTTEAENEKVRKWLADDPTGANEELLNDLHKVFDSVTLCIDNDTEPATYYQPRRKSRNILFAVTSMAAAIAIVVSIGLAVGYHGLFNRSRQLEAISVPAGQSINITLEDGTELCMNSGTTIERPNMFSRKDRTIYLQEGEIMLDVSKDSKRPFHVVTPSSDIEVLGTKFDVCLNDNTCTTTLLRGSLRITSSEGESVLLKPYDMAIQNADGSFTMGTITNTETVDCWTQGVINLVGHPFDELMKMFERSFDMTIIVACEEMPDIKLVRGKVRIIDGVKHALDVLSIGSDFSYEIDYNNNSITIR